ncbi:745_t:CDS:2 [Entrophospora sp. SA101]|nr:745_t:CDS:2 [Entrophospora sp. SA101]
MIQYLESYQNYLVYQIKNISFNNIKGLYLYGGVRTGKAMLMYLFTILSNSAAYDPIPPVSTNLANDAVVLCFDEFQVTDIADAMILRRLFECLFERGVVIVTTSNWHPDDLYKNGIQQINKMFKRLTTGKQVNEAKLELWGRYFTIPESCDDVAKFTFQELCCQPMSAADYLELTKYYNTIILTDVPRMF